jgi:DNA (cytosine-5)-methyltransferase 1
MKAATMFSGIGAPEVAMPHWDWLWHAEIEKFPNAVMAHHHPQSINLGDVNGKRFVERAEERGRPDVLVFGSPCQSFSVAGRRLGLDDPRGNLALVALGIVARLKPRWFVFENVPGLLSSDKGRDWGLFLRTVDELGYAGAWASLDAQYFGVAQRRQRLFFVGSSGDWRGPAAVLFEPESVCGHSPPSRAQRERIAPTVEARANGGGGGWGTDFLADGGMTTSHEVSKMLRANSAASMREDSESYAVGRIASTLSESSGHARPGDNVQSVDYLVPDVAWALQERDSKGVDSDTKDGHLIIAPMVATPILEAGARTGRVGHEDRDGLGIGEPNDPMFTLQGSKQHAIAFSSKDHGADAGEIAPTLRGMGHDASHANGGGQVAVAFAENQRAEVITADTVGALNNGGGKPGQGYPAVCFKPSHYTHDKDGAPSDVTPPLSSIARNGRGQPSDVVPALNGADAGTTSDMRPCVAVSPTLRSGGNQTGGDRPPGTDVDTCETLVTGSAIRRLTPRECERLQGFPDDYTLVSYRSKPAADGPRYKALGNSMAVPVIRWILMRIEAVDRQQQTVA